jgi:hypothetical protein
MARHDYISREAAIKEFCDDCMDREWCKSNGESCSRIKNINAVPAADVRPVVHGKWIVDSIATNIFYCSVCGNDAPVEPCGGTEYKSPFCPCCGADMRPREDDKTGIRKEQGPDGPI